jgi:haloacetate dehalogenase
VFEGFTSATLEVGETTIFVRRGGVGPPLLLLHGFPETHVMWHRVAPVLARDFTVVCADLRGYGASGKPPSSPEHTQYSKRVMALDMIRVMQSFGFERFCVAGHDRGARVAYRMALDHPGHVDRLAVLDVIPTSEALDRADARLALAFWPWSLLAQPAPLPERLITSAPDAVVNDALTHWGSDDDSCFPPEIRQQYIQAMSDPQTVHAICEEYRAAVSIDSSQEREDRAAGRTIGCPTLVLWSEGSALDEWYADAGGPPGIWRKWAQNVTGRAMSGGHFFPESNPDEVIRQLRTFFGAAA